MLNWIIFAFLLIFLFSGYKKGLFASALTFFSVFFAGLIALNFFESIGRWFSSFTEKIEPYSQGIIFLAIFLLVYTTLYILASTFLIESLKVRRLIDSLGGLFLAQSRPFLWWGYSSLAG